MLEVDALAKRYGEVWALRDLSLTLAQGECLVLLGRNGAGKTTALRCMAGVVKPTAGRVKVDYKPLPHQVVDSDVSFFNADKDKVSRKETPNIDDAFAKADVVAKKPRTIDHVHAAAVPVAGVTALQALVDVAH